MEIKRTIAILLAILFVVTVTATSVSAGPMGPTPFPSIASGEHNNHAYGTGHDNSGGNKDHGSNAGGKNFRSQMVPGQGYWIFMKNYQPNYGSVPNLL